MMTDSTDLDNRAALLEVDDRPAAPKAPHAVGACPSGDSAILMSTRREGFECRACGAEIILEAPAAPVAPVKAPAAPVAALPILGRPQAPTTRAALPAPTGMKTPAGVDMSPRMARVYSYLNHAGISITPFSTDSTVQAAKGKIAAARDLLLAPRLNGELPPHPTTLDVVTDINNILNRLPENRVAAIGEEAAVSTVAGEGFRGVRAAQGLVVTSVEGQFTGAMTYWSLAGSVDRTALVDAWNAQGLDVELLPKESSEKTALHNAMKKHATKKRLLRKHPDGGWILVDEKTVSDGEGKHKPDYSLGLRVRLEKDAEGKCKLIANRPENFPAEEAGLILKAVRAEYDLALSGKIASTEISMWMTNLVVGKLAGVALRETGGMYFVPKKHTETLKKVRAAFAACSSHTVYKLDAMYSEDTVISVLDGMAREVEQMITTMTGELNANKFGPRGIPGHLAMIDEAKAKLSDYSKFLGKDFTATVKRLDELAGKVSKVTTRASLLEVD
jgi:hypothetical protein